MSEVFRCGHPRTDANTKPADMHGYQRCRICQRVHEQRSQQKRRAAARMTENS